MINRPEKINKSKVNYQVEILEQGEAGLSKINDTKQYWSVVASWCWPAIWTWPGKKRYKGDT